MRGSPATGCCPAVSANRGPRPTRHSSWTLGSPGDPQASGARRVGRALRPGSPARGRPDPGHDEPEPAAAGRPLAGRAAGAGGCGGAADPLVVDLGYGASGVTTVELRDRLRTVRPDVDVVGIEIDPAAGGRGAAARGAGPGVRPRRLRAAGAGRPAAGRGARVQRAAPVRGGRGARRLGECMASRLRAGRARSSRARATRSAGGRPGSRWRPSGPLSLTSRCASPAWTAVGRRRAAAEGADPPQRARASGCTPCSPRSTTRGRGGAAGRVRGTSALVGVRGRRARGRVAGARPAGALAAGRGDGRPGTPSGPE